MSKDDGRYVESEAVAEVNRRMEKWMEEQQLSFWQNGTGQCKTHEEYIDNIKRLWRYSTETWPMSETESQIATYIMFTDPQSVIGLISSMLKDILAMEMRLNQKSIDT